MGIQAFTKSGNTVKFVAALVDKIKSQAIP